MSKTYRYSNKIGGKQIFEVFSAEREIKLTVEDCRNIGNRGGSGHSSSISNPTESIVMRRLTEIPEITLRNGEVIYYPDRWIKVIDNTYDRLTDDVERKVLKARFNGFHYTKICCKYNVSASQYYRICDRSYNFALAAACQLGLIKVM